MEPNIDINKVYIPSEDVVAREVQGEFIIIPVASGIGDSEDEIFSLNQTGRAIWDKMDGKITLKEIINILSSEFDASLEEVKKDVLGFSGELLKKKMLVESA